MGDLQNSIDSIMQKIAGFGTYSRLTIKWDKSTILPLDPLPASLDIRGLPLQVADRFKYLGVIVTLSRGDSDLISDGLH